MQTAKGRRTRSKTALKRLGTIPLETTSPKDYVAQLRAESDRGVIVLIATYIEESLSARLRDLLLRNDSSLEDRLFGPNGIVGTFSAKIAMMVAVGLISPAVAALVDHIRNVRNAAAHLTADITFEAPEMKDALLALFDDDSQAMMEGAPKRDYRDAYILTCMVIHQVATGQDDGSKASEHVKRITTVARKGIEDTGGVPFSRLYSRDPDWAEVSPS